MAGMCWSLLGGWGVEGEGGGLAIVVPVSCWCGWLGWFQTADGVVYDGGGRGGRVGETEWEGIAGGGRVVTDRDAEWEGTVGGGAVGTGGSWGPDRPLAGYSTVNLWLLLV